MTLGYTNLEASETHDFWKQMAAPVLYAAIQAQYTAGTRDDPHRKGKVGSANRRAMHWRSRRHENGIGGGARRSPASSGPNETGTASRNEQSQRCCTNH